jgi:hypothetical protein
MWLVGAIADDLMKVLTAIEDPAEKEVTVAAVICDAPASDTGLFDDLAAEIQGLRAFAAAKDKEAEDRAADLRARAAEARRNADLIEGHVKARLAALGYPTIVGPRLAWVCSDAGGQQRLLLPKDIKALPQAYRDEVVTYTANQKAIRAAISAGTDVPGCSLAPREKVIKIEVAHGRLLEPGSNLRPAWQKPAA